MDDVAVFHSLAWTLVFSISMRRVIDVLAKPFQVLFVHVSSLKTRGGQMQNSFVLVSSLLLLSRFDLIDGMLLVVRRGADVIEPNLVCFDKFGSNKKYSLLVLP